MQMEEATSRLERTLPENDGRRLGTQKDPGSFYRRIGEEKKAREIFKRVQEIESRNYESVKNK